MMGDPKYPLLSKDGDVTIGALFPIHSIETLPLYKFQQKPQLLSCSRFFTSKSILLLKIHANNAVCLTFWFYFCTV